MQDKKFKQQVARFDIGNLIRGMIDPTFSGYGLELEVANELARRSPTKPRGYLVPFEVLKRDLVVGTATAGGHTVATNLLADKFVDVLRPTSIIANLGATYLNGLVGGVAVPRQTSGATAYWVTENDSPTESQQAFDQVPMTPKTLGAYTDVSRKMLLQSSLDIKSFVISDLRASLGQELDRVVLGGSGSGNEPTGILNNSAISTVSLGTNGAALTWGNVVDLESTVAQANGDGLNMGYVTTKQVRGKMSQTQKVAATGAPFIWENSPRPQLPGEGVVNGLRAIASSLIPSNLTKGSGTNLSAMICGNWSDLLVGQWGAGIEIILDPYVNSTNGAIRIIAMTDVDFAVRHPESFIKIKDIVTT